MAQRDLSPMALVTLGLLLDGPQHPYELLRIMRKHHDDLRLPVSVGSIYHAVERLERDGLAEPVASDRDGARPERTTYAVTDAGRVEHRRRTRELLRTVEREYPSFDVGLGQADTLDAADVVALLSERLGIVETQRAAMRAGLESTLHRGVPRRFLLDGLYEVDRRAAHVAWLRRTIEEIESGELDWTAPLPAALQGAAADNHTAPPTPGDDQKDTA